MTILSSYEYSHKVFSVHEELQTTRNRYQCTGLHTDRTASRPRKISTIPIDGFDELETIYLSLLEVGELGDLASDLKAEPELSCCVDCCLSFDEAPKFLLVSGRSNLDRGVLRGAADGIWRISSGLLKA